MKYKSGESILNQYIIFYKKCNYMKMKYYKKERDPSSIATECTVWAYSGVSLERIDDKKIFLR